MVDKNAESLIRAVVTADSYESYVVALAQARLTIERDFGFAEDAELVEQGSDLELLYALVKNPDAFAWAYAKRSGLFGNPFSISQPSGFRWYVRKALCTFRRMKLNLYKGRIRSWATSPAKASAANEVPANTQRCNLSDDSILVSVVVPIFNVEQYVREALESVMGQTLSDIEIICVNDGSTDSSLAIVQELADIDNRIIIIDKENSGYGSAMNTGITHAHGEYIAILEPDDFIKREMLETLYSQRLAGGIWPADIVKGDYFNYYSATQAFPSCVKRTRVLQAVDHVAWGTVEQYPKLLKDRPAIWSAIYRRDFLISKDIKFEEVPGAGWVDNPFLYETACAAKRIVYVPEALYYYRRDNEGASIYLRDYNVPLDRIEDIFNIIKGSRIRNKRVWLYAVRRAFNYVMSVENSFPLSSRDEAFYARVKSIFSCCSESDVFGNEYVSDDGAHFFRDITGRSAAAVAPHKRPNNPSVSVVLYGHDVGRYACESLLSVLGQVQDFCEVIWQAEPTEGGCAKMLVEGIAQKDARVRYRCQSATLLANEMASEWIYFINAHNRLDASRMQKIRSVINATSAPLVVFGVEGHPERAFRECISHLVADTNQILFGRTWTVSDVCVRVDLLKKVLATFSSDPLEGDGEELFSALCLGAAEAEVVPRGNLSAILRSHGHPSVAAKSKYEEYAKRLASRIARIRRRLDESGAEEAAYWGFTHWAATGIVDVLHSCQDFEEYRSAQSMLTAEALPYVSDYLAAAPLDSFEHAVGNLSQDLNRFDWLTLLHRHELKAD